MANFHKIVDSRTQTVFTLESNATTLGELKQELIDNGYNLNNCIFQEGITKTEFKSDDALLPTNVTYRGETTNNLIFRISVSKGKINSGSSEVTTILTDMEDTIDNIVDSFDRLRDCFSDLSNSFGELSNQVVKLKSALQEQGTQDTSACSGTAKTSEYDKLNDMFDFDDDDL